MDVVLRNVLEQHDELGLMEFEIDSDIQVVLRLVVLMRYFDCQIEMQLHGKHQVLSCASNSFD